MSIKIKKSRSPHTPTDSTRGQVTAMCVAGIPHISIARVVGISDVTLRKHYKTELAQAADRANARVVGALFNEAISGNVAACIFWCKTRLRWREIDRVEMTGADGEQLFPTPRIQEQTREEWLRTIAREQNSNQSLN